MEYCIQKGKETSKCMYPTSMYSATALEWVSPQGVSFELNRDDDR